MKIKFQNICNKDLSLSFLKNQKIVSIIRRYYDKNLNDLSDEWNIYSQPKLFKDIVKECYLTVEENWNGYDFLISLGNNAAPFAYLLGVLHNKRVLYLDDEWGVTCFFETIKPSNVDFSDSKLLLIVPYFESGLKASRGIDVLNEQANNIHVDVLTIVFFPKYIDNTIFKNKKYKDCFLHYLFSWDDKVKKEVIKKA